MIDNPYSTELRYTLDLMAFYLKKFKPSRVRIATLSVEVAKAVVRRVCHEPYELQVENQEIQREICEALGVETRVREPDSPPAEVVLFPFSYPSDLQPEMETNLIVACENALSYKSFLYPGIAKGTIFGVISKLTQEYALESFAGLYSPQFIIWWTLAKLVERLKSAWYFRLEDRAMRQLIHFGPLWRFSYLVVFTGRLAG